MARGKPILSAGPSTLAKLVSHLKAPPKLALPYLSSLRLTLAARNDHFGARHFLKEQLPRIRYANPDLEIHVRKLTKRVKEEWRPELQLSFHDGTTQNLSLHSKWSTAIVRELMETAGSPTWVRWKAEAARAGLALVPGAEHEPPSTAQPRRAEPRFSVDEWRAKHPRKIRKRRRDTKTKAVNVSRTKQDKKQTKAVPVVPVVPIAEKAVDTEKAKEEAEKRRAAKKEARRVKLDAPRLAEEEAERRVALELLAKPRTGAAAVLP
ncbi:hypothetical protein B0H15DRAFT_809427 [Mycena belliarum]|uniref:Ribosomal protein/NADH dehydrogenase domain-containing protein n=1 Tax=Mycena belliarum TaxID=1033014 RepID=A0AAD6Y2C6_9AGAR|nr:hypothetical protein B0H15DRAFT_809427 [Mycena belliae]